MSERTTRKSSAPGRGIGVDGNPRQSRPSGPIRFRCGFRNTVLDVLRERPGWVEVDTDSDNWDFFWSDVSWVHENLDGAHLAEHQRINHFRNHYELTRKDHLLKNVKRQQRALEREANAIAAREEAEANLGSKGAAAGRVQHTAPFGGGGGTARRRGAGGGSGSGNGGAGTDGDGATGTVGEFFPFLPKSYVLPLEYNLFVEEFKRRQGGDPERNVWIMKPIGRAQGKGIFLITKLSQISDWKKGVGWSKAESAEKGVESYIVQSYIHNPYLIGGKKFDLRIYALVTSYRPLRAYLYRGGFARFTKTRFSMHRGALEDLYVHLTNTAVQKHNPDYDASRGAKWSLHALKQYMASHHGWRATDQCFGMIQALILRALMAVEGILIQDKHCFELYGYDVMIDADMRPWLIEVNASPSLSADTPSDYALKYVMLNDMVDVVDMEGVRPPGEVPAKVGGFDLIYDGGRPVQRERPSTYKCLLGGHNDSKHWHRVPPGRGAKVGMA
ncbi:unnamed protein product [Pedinophyceae sp. YPF-701]|nr:unnamed protein product [Pedinophyceae sp. YPF-701]